MELDPTASKADHEAAIAKFLVETDPELGSILVPHLKFEQLEHLSDSDRRRIRTKIAAEVRAALDAEGNKQ